MLILTTNIVGDGCNFKFAGYQLNTTELVDAGKEEQVIKKIVKMFKVMVSSSIQQQMALVLRLALSLAN